MEECAHDPMEIDRNNKRPQRRAVPPQAGVNPGSGWGGGRGSNTTNDQMPLKLCRRQILVLIAHSGPIQVCGI